MVFTLDHGIGRLKPQVPPIKVSRNCSGKRTSVPAPKQKIKYIDIYVIFIQYTL